MEISAISFCFICGFLFNYPVAINGEKNCSVIDKDFLLCKEHGNTLMSVQNLDSSNYSELHIYDRKITQIAANTFMHLTIAKLILELSTKSLTLYEDSLNGLPMLAELVILSGPVYVGEKVFRSLRYLKTLQLTISEKHFVPETLADFQMLKNLIIIDSDIKNITNGLFPSNLSSMSNLSLRKNKIISIQRKVFSSLTKLENLDLSFNELEYLQSGIFNGMEQLEELDLTENNLNKIPNNAFAGLERLAVLYIDRNNIDEIEENGFSGMNIVNLTLSSNRFEYLLPRVFNKIQKLKYLNLANNIIRKIKIGTFSDLNLSVLDLRNNKLICLDSGTFEGLTVRELILSNNEIINIQYGTFSYSTIELVHLSYFEKVDRVIWGLRPSTKIIFHNS